MRTPAGERRLSLPYLVALTFPTRLACSPWRIPRHRLDTLVAALERGVRVPGRVEPVDAGQDFAVLVDYAHTPDSLGERAQHRP